MAAIALCTGTSEHTTATPTPAAANDNGRRPLPPPASHPGNKLADSPGNAPGGLGAVTSDSSPARTPSKRKKA
ncbi:hypothetical protein GCM10022223_32930 [Kineosporia mesophila]|uniref:Uncharacterized protein n=1 Tax=Kineosporia mesophila TaxID=566012 RepID=A0ABP6ZR04_9ACTN